MDLWSKGDFGALHKVAPKWNRYASRKMRKRVPHVPPLESLTKSGDALSFWDMFMRNSTDQAREIIQALRMGERVVIENAAHAKAVVALEHCALTGRRFTTKRQGDGRLVTRIA